VDQEDTVRGARKGPDTVKERYGNRDQSFEGCGNG
jgi:hypothetical protein